MFVSVCACVHACTGVQAHEQNTEIIFYGIFPFQLLRGTQSMSPSLPVEGQTGPYSSGWWGKRTNRVIMITCYMAGAHEPPKAAKERQTSIDML